MTGIGCTQKNAVAIMTNLLKLNTKDSDRVAYHAYQSFAKGEVDATMAHSIGVAFADEMWGGRFPVIVATHLDRGHLHNHFAICAVGFDGKRLHVTATHYRRMREVSDRLCIEHGLSVIKEPSYGKTKHVGEIKATMEGRPTVRDMIRRDIDAAIEHCFTYPQFVNTFQALGYTLEWRGQYLRIRPDQSTKFFRMDKLGAGYTYKDVQERIKANARSRRIIPYTPYKPKDKPKGLYALYLHYCYLLGELPKQRPNNREAYAVIRDDVRRARMYSEEARLLGKYEIHTAEGLSLFTKKISEKYQALAYERGKLRNRLRHMHDTEKMQSIKDRISELTGQMAVLRKEMRLCEDIALRSGVIEQVVNTIDIPNQNPTRKEEKENEKEKRR